MGLDRSISPSNRCQTRAKSALATASKRIKLSARASMRGESKYAVLFEASYVNNGSIVEIFK